MTAATLESKKQDKSLITFILAATGIAFFLGFIDEGYYDFRWMKDFWNWVILGVYALFMLIGQLSFYHVILKHLSGSKRMTMSIIFGSLFGFIILAAVLLGVVYTG